MAPSLAVLTCLIQARRKEKFVLEEKLVLFNRAMITYSGVISFLCGSASRSGGERGKISKNFPTGSAGGNETRKVKFTPFVVERRLWYGPLPREEGEMRDSADAGCSVGL